MNYEDRFWEIYNSSPENGEKLELIMDSLGIQFEEAGDEVRLNYDEYQDVVEEFEDSEGSVIDDESFMEEVVDALSERFSDVSTFEDAGVMTMNKGIVVRVNGKEYQLELLGSY